MSKLMLPENWVKACSCQYKFVPILKILGPFSMPTFISLDESCASGEEPAI